ncbi:MAG: helix-turn-helix transcriptional regulator [Patescibacteria group bacterium]
MHRIPTFFRKKRPPVLTLKNRLRVLRAEKDITQETLAKAVGVSRQTIHAIERGKDSPNCLLACKIARFFGAPLEKVFWIEEDTDYGAE